MGYPSAKKPRPRQPGESPSAGKITVRKEDMPSAKSPTVKVDQLPKSIDVGEPNELDKIKRKKKKYQELIHRMNQK